MVPLSFQCAPSRSSPTSLIPAWSQSHPIMLPGRSAPPVRFQPGPALVRLWCRCGQQQLPAGAGGLGVFYCRFFPAHDGPVRNGLFGAAAPSHPHPQPQPGPAGARGRGSRTRWQRPRGEVMRRGAAPGPAGGSALEVLPEQLFFLIAENSSMENTQFLPLAPL